MKLERVLLWIGGALVALWIYRKYVGTSEAAVGSKDRGIRTLPGGGSRAGSDPSRPTEVIPSRYGRNATRGG